MNIQSVLTNCTFQTGIVARIAAVFKGCEAFTTGEEQRSTHCLTFFDMQFKCRTAYQFFTQNPSQFLASLLINKCGLSLSFYQ